MVTLESEPDGGLRARKLSACQQNDATKYVALAKSLAQPFKLADWNQRDEFESAAMTGLVVAALTHDRGKRTAFASYARRKIRCALLDARRRLARSARVVPFQGWTGPTHDKPVGSELESADFLEWCLRQLPTRQQGVCRLIYACGMSQRETAAASGLSESYVSELHDEALETLLDMLSKTP